MSEVNDLISRSALLRGVPSSRKATGKTAWDYGVLYMENAVKNAPAVDAVEVVRCKDCKHYLKAMMFCEHPGGLEVPDKMDFCSYGERRSDDGG